MPQTPNGPTYWPIGIIEASAPSSGPRPITIGPAYITHLPEALAAVWANPALRGQPAHTWADAIRTADTTPHPRAFAEWVATGLVTPWPWYHLENSLLINPHSLLLAHAVPEQPNTTSLYTLITDLQRQGYPADDAANLLVEAIPQLLSQPDWYLLLDVSPEQVQTSLRNLQAAR